MKTKVFLLLSIMMLAAATKAQTPFQWGEIEFEVVDSNADTAATPAKIVTDTLAATPAPTITGNAIIVPVYQRTWQNLEQQLKAEFKEKTKERIIRAEAQKQEVRLAYEVSGVPTKSGKKTLFLCNLKNGGGYVISYDNPNSGTTINDIGPGILQADGAAPEKLEEITIPPQNVPQRKSKGCWK